MSPGGTSEVNAIRATALNVPGLETNLPEDLTPVEDPASICLNTTMNRIEAMYIERALIRAGCNISKAGRFLNLSPQSLRYRMKKLGIQVPAEHLKKTQYFRKYF
jgi:transcriptional regulator with GAF, ATPase, and Fis domain